MSNGKNKDLQDRLKGLPVAELQAARPDLVILDSSPTEEVREAFEDRIGKLVDDDDQRKAVLDLMASEDTIQDRLELAAYRLHHADLEDGQTKAAQEALAATAKQFSIALPSFEEPAQEDEPDEPTTSPTPGPEGDDTAALPSEAEKRLNFLEAKDAATEAINNLGDDYTPKYKATLLGEVVDKARKGDLAGREEVADYIKEMAARDKRGAEALADDSPASSPGVGPTDPTSGSGPKTHRAASQFVPLPKEKSA